MGKYSRRNILFVAPQFFGYEIKIKAKLEEGGANVIWLPDRPFSSAFMKAVTKVLPKVVAWFASFFYRKILERSGQSVEIDTIFVINGQTLSSSFLKDLKEFYPNARSVLYLWDSLANRANIIENLSLYDAVFSFDSIDVEKYGLNFRPLFFSDEIDSEEAVPSRYDLSFVGTVHSDRYSILNSIIQSLPKHVRVYWYFYLQAKWVFYLYILLKKPMRRAEISAFKFEPLNRSELNTVYSTSAAVVDIEHPAQTGLTMRTLEVLGAGKKLITTNGQVRDYDFFEFGNVLVLDRSNPAVPIDFLDRPFVPYPPEVYFKYSLSGWLQEILT